MKISSETSKILSKEHENILKVVDVLEFEIEKLKNKSIDIEYFKKVIDFIRNYADKFHHAKEEDILFKEFNKCAEEGNTHCNPVEQMLFEHEEGRKNVKLMAEGVNEKDKDKLTTGAINYIQLIRDHIFKEDNILYPMADEVLNDKTKKNMLEKFKKINADKIKDVEEFEKFAKEVTER